MQSITKSLEVFLDNDLRVTNRTHKRATLTKEINVMANHLSGSGQEVNLGVFPLVKAESECLQQC